MNYWAILVCGVLAQGLGAFWWSPAGFGKRWMKQMGWDKLSEKEIKKKQKEATPGYIGSFVGALVMATILAHLLELTGVTGWQTGLRLGIGLWLGFVATTMSMPSLWEGRSWCLYRISAGYYLVQIAVFSLVLSLW